MKKGSELWRVFNGYTKFLNQFFLKGSVSSNSLELKMAFNFVDKVQDNWDDYNEEQQLYSSLIQVNEGYLKSVFKKKEDSFEESLAIIDVTIDDMINLKERVEGLIDEWYFDNEEIIRKEEDEVLKLTYTENEINKIDEIESYQVLDSVVTLWYAKILKHKSNMFEEVYGRKDLVALDYSKKMLFELYVEIQDKEFKLPNEFSEEVFYHLNSLLIRKISDENDIKLICEGIFGEFFNERDSENSLWYDKMKDMYDEFQIGVELSRLLK